VPDEVARQVGDDGAAHAAGYLIFHVAL